MDMQRQQQRQSAVRATVASINNILDGRTPDSETLELVARQLQGLADLPELFPLEDFPAPAPGSAEASSRYLLSQEDDGTHALYINSINPGKTSKPHNHGTWAVIVALSGEELNRIYRRTDDGREPDMARLELDREFVVKPGSPISFQPDDIHSIHVGGASTVRHFHFYGRALETLTQRLGFDLETGRVLPYNKNFMRPTAGSDVGG